MDRYTKIVLTFIAFALWANLFVSLSPSGGGLIRDAHAQGLIDAPDAAAKAQMLFAYFQGVLTQARIQNDVEVLRQLYPAMLDLLDAKITQPAGA